MGQAIAVTDRELLEASRRGEREAFGALVERYQEVVCAVSYSRTRDLALSEDVAQDTFIAAWRQLDQLREPSRLRSWLCGIARNLAAKARRRGARETAVDDPIVVSGDNPFDALCAAETERIVASALERVPDTYRDVLVLYYREQWPAREIADALGLTEAAVAQRLARGRQYLASSATALVESSLRGQRVKRDLRARVLAALPPIVPSQVETTTSSSGGTMLKIAIAVLGLAAAGTTAYVVHASEHAPAGSPALAASSASPRPAAAATAGPALPAPQAAPAKDPSLPPGAVMAPEPDKEPYLDRVKLQQLGMDRGPSRGAADAPVTIVMFTDMYCKFCADSLGSLDQLIDEYPNKLRVIVKQLPIHRNAEKRADLLAEALYAADAQGKFWELHDAMRAQLDELSPATLPKLAAQVGLDMPKFQAALDQHTFRGAVDADRAAAQAIEAKATPTFVINGRRITGWRPIREFRKAIDAALVEIHET